jgi:hypothetical protein
MIIDPAKADVERVLALLGRLSALTPPRKGDPNDWAAKTASALKAGKLETFDLVEFLADAFEKNLAGKEGDPKAWEYSRALLELAEEMERLGARGPKTARVKDTLKSWTAA